MKSSFDDMLEDDFREPYTAWKTVPGPESNAAMLTALHPTIEGAIKTHVGQSNPLLYSRGRKLALSGLKTYDPKRGRLQSHMYNYLTGLKRVNQQQTTILKVPQRVALDKYNLDAMEHELANELGREPTDDEIANRTGFSSKRLARSRTYLPTMAEGTADRLLDGNTPQSSAVQRHPSVWPEIVYDELDPYHRKIMELAFGLNGRTVLQNQVIAEKMKRSPGAISQAKARIQALLDQEYDLSPFQG